MVINEDGAIEPAPRRASDGDKASGSNVPMRPAKQPCWTDYIPRTEHNALFLDLDYGKTSLGPIEDWGPALRAYATMLFADSRGAGICWGPERILLYNEPFSVMAAGQHPFAMGRGFAEVFPEIATSIVPLFEQAYSTGQTVNVDDILLFVERSGYLEETYFIGQWIPLRGDGGQIDGFYNTVLESTSKVLHERRRCVVDQISTVVPRSIDQTLSSFMDAIRTNPHDITAAALYSYDLLAPSGADNLHRRGIMGFPDDHLCVLRMACLETCQDGLIPCFRTAKSTRQPVVLSLADDNPPTEKQMFRGIDWCGYGEQSKTIVIYALAVSDDLLGFYVQGTNPRRAYDEGEERSIADLVTQLEVKWATSIARESAQMREQALERRASESENRLRVMAQNAPMGMYQIGTDLNIQWANEQFYNITGHDRSKPSMAEFRHELAPEEREKDRVLMERLLDGGSGAPREIRLRRKFTPPQEDNGPLRNWSAWVLAVTVPTVQDGQVTMLLGYLVDISRQKWAEGVKMHQARVAEEAKQRQQGEFLDVTSHELRNPLSAITQLADGIAKSSDVHRNAPAQEWPEIVQENVEAASIILTCASHQKRIIDEVLILSRLDSQLLTITPTVARPGSVVDNTIKMLEGLAALSKIQISAVRGNDSDEFLNLEHIMIDTSRLTQILMNLVENAIKFTASQDVREILVTFGMQGERPPYLTTRFGDLEWLPSTDHGETDTSIVDIEGGERKVYAYFLVQDTGPGLTDEEAKRLFKRFSQASTKTHVMYGGSGLGLYICRKLLKKQGGGVGVASRHGEGSVFAFYLETKAATLATEDNEDIQFRTEAQGNVPAEREGFHVLLVEDNIINQRVLTKQLKKAKCRVEVANHGIEALQILDSNGRWQQVPGERTRAEPIEVVLMDIEMPVMNGEECTKEIRRLEAEHDSGERLPIIAMTADARQEQQERLLAIGVDCSLARPFRINDVLSKVEKCVRRS